MITRLMGVLRRRPQGSVWLAMGIGGRLALSATAILLVARRLGAGSFGILAGTLALATVLAPFAGWGSGNIMLMHTARDRARYPQASWQALLTMTIGAATFGIVGWVIARAVIGRSFDASLAAVLMVTELYLFRLAELWGQAFQAHARLRSMASIQGSIGALKLAAAVGFIAVGSSSIHAWIGWYLGAGVLAALAATTYAWASLGPPRFGATLSGDDVRDGFYFSLGISSKTVYADIDKTMLLRLATAPVAGVYAVAYRLLTALFTPIQATIMAANADMFRHGEAGLGGSYRYARTLIPTLLVMCLAASIVLFFFAPAIPVLLGSDYREAATVLRWLCLMPLVQGTHFLLGDALMGGGLQGPRSMAQLAAAAANVLLNLALIPAMSWKGAVAATYVAETLLVAMMVAIIRRRSVDASARSS